MSLCSPVCMSLSITLPSAISFSPIIATKGICLALAYAICFFILTVSGYISVDIPALRAIAAIGRQYSVSFSPKLMNRSLVESTASLG